MDTAAIWKNFNQEIFQYVLRKVPSESDTKDIVQEVFVKVHLKIHQLKDSDKLVGWIYQIARNTINDFYRKKKMTTSLPDLAEVDEEPLENFDNCFRPFVDQLPKIYREALIATELEGMSQKMYAEQINCAYSTVKSRVQRAKKILHNIFISCCNISSDSYGNIVEFERSKDCTCNC